VFEMQTKNERPRAGDWIEVDAPKDLPRRRGLILEVLGQPGHERYRVQWDEQHESLFYPSAGAHVLPRRRSHHSSSKLGRGA